MSGGKNNETLLFGGCNCDGKCKGNDCCNDHTVLPVDGPPDPALYCDKAHGSTFQSGFGACVRYWTKINDTCTAADYFEEFQPKYIGLRRPGTEPEIVVPRGIITPIPMTEVRVDTTKTHTSAGAGLCLPCKAVWNIAGRVNFKHPLELENNPPAMNGVLGPNSVLTVYIGRNGGYSYAREYTPAQFVNPLWIPIHVDRTECLSKDDKFTLSAYWEDPDNNELQELEIVASSITAEFISYCDSTAV